MAIFTAISFAATAILGPGTLSVLGLSPALTSALFSAGRSIGWSMASAALNRPKVPRQQVLANITQTDGPRIRAYGRVLLGGQRAFWETDQEDGNLHQIILLHHGQLAGLVSFWVDGKPVQVTAAGAVTNDPFDSSGEFPDLLLQFRDGAGNGGTYPPVTAAFPTLWTTNHKLQEQATLYARLNHPGNERFSKVFPKGAQTLLQAEVLGSFVRTATGALNFSENAAFCVRDYLTHPDGFRIASSAMDDTLWNNFAALSAEAVPLREGGTEQRYRIGGYYSLDDAPKEVMGRMLAACDGQVFQTAEGKVGIIGGRWSEPDVTITADDIMEFHAKPGFDPFTDFNVLKGSFISAAHDYQPTELPEIRDAAALATQPERTEQLDFDMVPSGAQAQRLMKIHFAKNRRATTGTLTTNLVGLKARFPKADGIHTIRIAAPEFGLNGVFEVTSHRFSVPDGWCEIGIASIANPYGWNAATEERPLPATTAQLRKATDTALVPAGASLTQVPVRVSADVYGGKLRLTVNSVARRDLTLQAQVAPGDVAVTSTTARWTEMGGDRFSAETGILQNEQVYTVRYRWRGQAAWQRAGAVTIVANPNVPAVPTEFQRIGSSGVELTWRNPSDNFWKARIFRSQTNSFAGAAQVLDIGGTPGLVSTFRGSQATGTTWFYWVVALNGSSVASPPAGPISISS